MAWNGSGVFARLYNWTTDAANGIKILASKMDDEFNGLVTGLNNALCKDGQNVPTANISWNNKKITNLAAGTTSTDAVNKSQLDAVSATEWNVESSSVSFVSATSFKVLGSDKRTTYHVGRRVRTINTGGTVYGTVSAVSYSAPDTTVTVQNDLSVALDAGLSAAAYGMVSYANPSYLSPRGIVAVLNTASTAFAGSATGTLAWNVENMDTNSEFSGNTWSPIFSGYYRMSVVLPIRMTANGAFACQVQVLGATSGGGQVFQNSSAGWLTGELAIIAFSLVVRVVKGDGLTIWFANNGAALAIDGTFNNAKWDIDRIA